MYRINVNVGSSYLSLRVPMQSGRGNLGLAVMTRLLRYARNDTGKTAMTTFIRERS
jgi:hypothetical protein